MEKGRAPAGRQRALPDPRPGRGRAGGLAGRPAPSTPRPEPEAAPLLGRPLAPALPRRAGRPAGRAGADTAPRLRVRDGTLDHTPRPRVDPPHSELQAGGPRDGGLGAL